MRVFAWVSSISSLALVVAAAACSNASTSSGAGGDATTTTTSTSTVTTSASATGAGGAAILCNPFLDACPAAQACDVADDGNFYCFPGANSVDVCGACDEKNGPFCKVGMSCQLPLADGSGDGCARFCCTDDDCGPGGVCDLGILGDTHDVGLCTDGTGADGGRPGPACGTPVESDAAPPDGGGYGACFH